MKRCKVMFYINTLEYGGAERVISLIANGFYDRGYEVAFVTTFANSQEYILNPEITHFYLEHNRMFGSVVTRNVKRIRRLRSIVKRENPDFLISFLAEANFRSVLATSFLKTKTIISIRNDPHKEYANPITFKIAQILFCFSSLCVFQTQDALSSFNQIIKRKGKIILNPISDVFFTSDRNKKCNDIITVGRLEEQKNHVLLINAYSRIANDFPSVKLKIFGNGSKKDELQNLINKLGMKSQIILMGNSDNISKELDNAKIFVLSSDYEGLPNSLMEAIAKGIPVISTDCPCGGASMLIKDGENGYLTEVKNISQMSERLECLLKNSEIQKSFTEKNYIIREKFRSKKILDEWEVALSNIETRR